VSEEKIYYGRNELNAGPNGVYKWCYDKDHGNITDCRVFKLAKDQFFWLAHTQYNFMEPVPPYFDFGHYKYLPNLDDTQT
jgi:hypothetical protein